MLLYYKFAYSEKMSLTEDEKRDKVKTQQSNMSNILRS